MVKIEVIENLPPSISVKGIHIANPLFKLLEKKVKFVFDDVCLEVFEFLKENFILALIIVSHNWSMPFKVMCDASGIVQGTVLG